jgi:hypothetical protein
VFGSLALISLAKSRKNDSRARVLSDLGALSLLSVPVTI